MRDRVHIRLERGGDDVDEWTARAAGEGDLLGQWRADVGPATPGEVLEELGQYLDGVEAARATELADLDRRQRAAAAGDARGEADR